MFKLVSLALVALAALSAVDGFPIAARATPPAGWISEILESYDAYHTRYLAVGCQGKHNTPFFDDCCHPMKKGETLEKNRKPYCTPVASPVPSPTTPVTLIQSPAPSPSPAPAPVPGDDDDCDDDGDDGDDDGDDGDNGDDNDDDDCGEEPVPSPAPSDYPVPTTTPSPQPTTSPSPPEPTTTPTTPKPSTSTTPKPSPTPPSSETHTGGHVTWYTQNGNYGACGNKHSDDDFIAALDYRAYGNLSAKSKYCGQKIRVSWQGKSVDVTVEDACPSCDNGSSVDLSTAAFKALAPLDVGMLTDVTWELL